MQTELILASQSPRRGSLLEQVGIGYVRMLPLDAEAAEALEVVQDGEPALDYVRRVSLLKLRAALEQLRTRPGSVNVNAETEALEAMQTLPVLCADTTVSIDGVILAKPADTEEAREMLQRLSGRTHEVITAVAMGRVQDAPDALQLQHQITQVSFRSLTAEDMDAYLRSDEWRGKAGSYGIQGRAARFVQDIHGSYSGVVGLPLHLVDAMLSNYR